jgi:hypothetical protein
VPASPDRSSLIPDTALGALLGLILGVGLAALIETLRPTLVGREVLARELNTPVLGTVTEPTDAGPTAGGDDIAGRLHLAAATAGVGKVALVPAKPGLDVEHIARGLDAPLKVEPFDARTSGGLNGSRSGLVLISPTTLRREELDQVVHLLRVSPGPLLGLVAYEPVGTGHLDQGLASRVASRLGWER